MAATSVNQSRRSVESVVGEVEGPAIR